jgi:hypothetical protein
VSYAVLKRLLLRLASLQQGVEAFRAYAFGYHILVQLGNQLFNGGEPRRNKIMQ